MSHLYIDGEDIVISDEIVAACIEAAHDVSDSDAL